MTIVAEQDAGGRIVEDLVRHFQAQQPIRAGSLIITVFGDAIAPRGGEVWLGTLLTVMEAFGVNGGLVRTAMSRLAADGWVDRSRVGRRSYYHLSAAGQRRVAGATQRIYAGPPADWDGSWRFVIIPGGPGEARDALKKELAWHGFGNLAPAVMAHPNGVAIDLDAILEDQGMAEAVVVVAGQGPAQGAVLRDLAADCWTLEPLAERYTAFLDLFRPVAERLAGGVVLTPLQSLVVRLSLVHEYRKAILRDPQLPPPLLPADWPGRRAHETAGEVYRAVAAAADMWLDDNAETEAGDLPPADAAFSERFGGLAL